MVIIPSALKRFKYQVGDALEVITIESRSGAWASIEKAMQNLNLRRVSSLESFLCCSDGDCWFWARASASWGSQNWQS